MVPLTIPGPCIHSLVPHWARQGPVRNSGWGVSCTVWAEVIQVTARVRLPVTGQYVEEIADTREGGGQNGHHPDSWKRKGDRRGLGNHTWGGLAESRSSSERYRGTSFSVGEHVPHLVTHILPSRPYSDFLDGLLIPWRLVCSNYIQLRLGKLCRPHPEKDSNSGLLIATFGEGIG